MSEEKISGFRPIKPPEIAPEATQEGREAPPANNVISLAQVRAQRGIYQAMPGPGSVGLFRREAERHEVERLQELGREVQRSWEELVASWQADPERLDPLKALFSAATKKKT